MNRKNKSELNFCFACGSQQECRLENRTLNVEVRGESVEVTVPVSVCPSCEEEMVIGSTDPSVLAYNVYRERNRLLMPHEIAAIRKKYSLPQKALALLIGMGEVTINRYERGALQDATHDSMIRAFDNPSFVLDALDRRGHLLSKKQRSNAHNAAQSLLKEDDRHNVKKNSWKNGLSSIVTKVKGAQDLIEQTGSTWALPKDHRLTA